MFLRIRCSNLSVSIRHTTSKIINFLVFFLLLVPSLTGVYPVQAATTESELTLSQVPSLETKQELIDASLSSEPSKDGFSILQQAPACPAGGDLVVEDGDECSLSPGTHSYGSVTVQSGGNLILESDPNTNSGVTLQAEYLAVETGGLLEANGQGYAASTGPGAGVEGSNAGGAGHGGMGGNGEDGTLGGNTYGDLFEPISIGSGGGSTSSDPGGAGGGAIKLEIANEIVLNGMISANGFDGQDGSGGGTGGSIWILSDIFSGSGDICADGGGIGAYYDGGGGGAGGRIAIDVSSTDTFSGTVSAYGNGGNQTGAAGTIYWTAEDHLIIDNSSQTGAVTTLASDHYIFNQIDIFGNGILRILGADSQLTLTNDTLDGDGSGRLEVEGTINAPSDYFIWGVTLVVFKELSGPINITIQEYSGLELTANASPYLNGVFSFESVTIQEGAVLHLVSYDGSDADYGVTLQLDSLFVDEGGVIEADGQGYAASTGPGAGFDGGGAGHGGVWNAPQYMIQLQW